MIFVTLGTQDKDFSRLLKAIDNQIENKKIKDKVIVQAGYTKYKSKNMEIFDLIDSDQFKKYVKDCDILITHGGVGSILNGIQLGKKVIAAARLKRYGEHTNDHQKQIIKKFVEEGYILELKDFNEVDRVLEKIKKFKPKKFESNNKEFTKLISNYIDNDCHTSWFNKYRNLCSYGYLGIFRTLINIFIFSILFSKLNLYVNIIVSFFITFLLELVLNIFSNVSIKKYKLKYLLIKIFSLVFDINTMYIIKNHININLIEGKFISSFIIMFLNILIIKLCFQEE